MSVEPAGSRRPKRPGTRSAFIDVEHDGRTHRVTLKRVATARRFTLRVRGAGADVVLTLPPHGSTVAARAFARRHAGWIAEKLAGLEPTVALVPGAVVPFRGRPHVIERRTGLRRRVWTEEDRDAPKLCVCGPDGAVETAVLAFFRMAALSDLTAAVERHAASVGRPVRGMTLRDTRSRWGSCSGRGMLNFSWRLVLAPPVVLDYLAAHEVCHLVHMNHGDAFWALLATLAPRMAEAERWLKQHGAGLHLYGARSSTAPAA